MINKIIWEIWRRLQSLIQTFCSCREKHLERAFLKAAHDGDLKLVKRLAPELGDGKGLTKGYESITDEKGMNALHWAAAGGKIRVCRFLVEKLKFNVKSTDIKGATPLFVAIIRRQHQTVVYLIENGAEAIDYICPRGETALHLIAELGQKTILRLLLSKGAKVDHDRSITPNSPLEVACCHGKIECMKLLLDNGADPNSCSKMFSPLTSSVVSKSFECMELLLKAGADPNICKIGRSPLQLAVLHPDVRMIKRLLKAGANPNVLDPMMLATPLEMAAMLGDATAVKTLLPFTSRIPSIPDWSVDGIIKHCCSDEVSIQMIKRQENQLQLSKAKAQEAFEKKDYDAALSWYYQASLSDQHNAALIYNRSFCWIKLNQGRRALDDATDVVVLKPDWAKAHYMKGAACMLLKEYSKALEAFSQALWLDPNNMDIEKAKREAQAAERGMPVSDFQVMHL